MSAVSGGAYIAGGWAVARGELDAVVKDDDLKAAIEKLYQTKANATVARDGLAAEVKKSKDAVKDPALSAAIKEFSQAEADATVTRGKLDATVKDPALSAAIEKLSQAEANARVARGKLEAAIKKAKRASTKDALKAAIKEFSQAEANATVARGELDAAVKDPALSAAIEKLSQAEADATVATGTLEAAKKKAKGASTKDALKAAINKFSQAEADATVARNELDAEVKKSKDAVKDPALSAAIQKFSQAEANATAARGTLEAAIKKAKGASTKDALKAAINKFSQAEADATVARNELAAEVKKSKDAVKDPALSAAIKEFSQAEADATVARGELDATVKDPALSAAIEKLSQAEANARVARGKLEAAIKKAKGASTKDALNTAIEKLSRVEENATVATDEVDAAIKKATDAVNDLALQSAIEKLSQDEAKATVARNELDAAINEFNRAKQDATVASGERDRGKWAKRLLSPRSPEERWVRLHSSHLLGSASVYLVGALRLAVGALFGLFLIWLLLFAVAAPVGWVMSSPIGHEELRARTPILSLDSDVVLSEANPVLVGSAGTLDGETPVELYKFVPRYSPAQFTKWDTVTSGESTTAYVQVRARWGYVRVTQGEAEIAAQPTLEVVRQPAPGEPDSVVVRRQPTFTLTSTELPVETAGKTAARIQGLLESDVEAALGEQTGLTGRSNISIAWWQWLVSLGLIAVGLLVYLVRVLWRHFRETIREGLEWVAKRAAGLGAAGFAVLVALPWLVQEVPLFVARLTRAQSLTDGSAGGAPIEGVLTLLGVTGLLATALRAFTQLAIKQGKQHLGLVIRIVVAILVPLMALLVTVSLLRLSAANSVDGRYLGFGAGMELPDWFLDTFPDWFMAQWFRFVIVLGILALLSTVDAHAWSLFPFYKRQLNEAYNLAPPSGEDKSLRSVDYAAGPVLLTPVDAVHLRDRGDVAANERARRGHGHLAPRGKAKLVLCCAANVHSKKKAPPGRRAVSMTFDEDWVGSPELGWIETKDYQNKLSRRRLSDVTVPSLQAISGAAISPGMGKFTMGPLDSMLALLNVRLGVWLPNPRHVKDYEPKTVRGRERPWPGPKLQREWQRFPPSGKPWWIYYLFEVGRYFPWDKKYVYVSDGGHWENLGLVELLRRGCTEIYCVSAAGDGPESFSTLGEALALARESLGAEFDIDLTDLRAAGATAPESGRRLRRRKAKKKNAELATDPWASKPFVAGTFTIPSPDGTRVKGRLLVVEANLTDAMPWDVQAWAESNPAFPDDPTSDQLFDHRQFESYRALGWHQLGAGLRSDQWRQLGRWTSAADPPSKYRLDYCASEVKDVAVAATASATTWLHVDSDGGIFVRSSADPHESWRPLPPIRFPWPTHAKRITAAARSEEVIVAYIGTDGYVYWAVLAASLSATSWRPLGAQARDIALVAMGEGRWRILVATDIGELRSFLVPGDRSDGYPVKIKSRADWVAAARDEQGRTLVAIAGPGHLRCGFLDDAESWRSLKTQAEELSLIVTANGPEVLFMSPGHESLQRWPVRGPDKIALPGIADLSAFCATVAIGGQLQLIGCKRDGTVVLGEP